MDLKIRNFFLISLWNWWPRFKGLITLHLPSLFAWHRCCCHTWPRNILPADKICPDKLHLAKLKVFRSPRFRSKNVFILSSRISWYVKLFCPGIIYIGHPGIAYFPARRKNLGQGQLPVIEISRIINRHNSIKISSLDDGGTSSGSPSAVLIVYLQSYLIVEIFLISRFRSTLHNHPS